MSLFGLSHEQEERLVNAVCLLAAVFSMGVQQGHSTEDVKARADEFKGYVKGERDE